MTKYCEVALPVPLRQTFTYGIPAALAGSIAPGSRVLVPFRSKPLVGVVLEVHARAPNAKKIKDIREALDPLLALPPRLVELGQWVANYYLAPVGEVFRAMLPPAVDVHQSRELVLRDAGRQALAELKSLANRSEAQVAEMALLQLLEIEGQPLSAARLKKLIGGEVAAERLARRGAVEFREIARRRMARTQKIVAWRAAASDERVSGAEERIRTLLTAERGPLPLAQLLKLAQVSRSVIERLEREGKLQSWDEPVALEELVLDPQAGVPAPPNVLNAGQQRAFDEIDAWMRAGKFRTGLLHGVTGSGKTEVYLRAVEAALAAGRCAIVLVPEIALTLWISRLARARFGDVVAVLHSGLPDVERAREWWRVRRGEARVIVGTRSAVFAPCEQPAVIIVDEEQESAYKQEETPRYHGRDVAIVRARMENAVALLGSATPSMESFHHARSGKYELLELEGRVENRPMAAVRVVDLREDFKQTHRASAISRPLHDALAARLQDGTQSLVLINRRGYSWFVLCRSCGAAVQCQNCSISLTYHKRRERLLCHYCGYSAPVPKKCPKCQSEHVYFFGEGAEQVEELLRRTFTHARVARLDRDAVRSKREYQQVLAAFANHELDILVGTQMLAKGHDFHKVTLVGVVSADLSLALPDFRAAERTFQLLTQVAGRAGRGELRGEVLVQTFYPEHYAIQHAVQQDYASFFEKELHFRRLMHYPPFTALANLIVRDRKLENAVRWSRALAGYFDRVAAGAGVKVLGPAAAPLARIKQEYRFQFLLKSPRRAALNKVLSGCLDFCEKKKIPETAVMADVDPLSLM